MPEAGRAVFIVGVPRSGTTWLLSILESHPDCRAVTADMLGIEVAQPTKETGLFVRGFSDADILERWARLPNDKLLVEKTPVHIRHTARIRQLLGAKVVLIRRNPLDVLNSMLKPNVFWPGSPKTLDDALVEYNKFNLPPARIEADIHLRYEALWAEPVAVTNRLFSQLGLNQNHTEEIIASTRYGRNLPDRLKTVFDKGTTGQGDNRFTPEELARIRQAIGEAAFAAANP